MFLRQPYPLTEMSPRRIFLTGLLAGAFVAIFLIVFQPFGTYTVDFPHKTLFLVGYGVIMAVIMWIAMIAGTFLFEAERWTVGKQIALLLGTSLFGITVSYFYLHLLGGTPDWASYWIFLRNALTVGVFPLVGIVLADYFVKLKRYESGAATFNARPNPAPPSLPRTSGPAPEPPAPPADDFTLYDEQERPVLTLPADRIWCLRSDRNYVDIFHLNADGQPTKTTVRNTLTKVSAALPDGFLRSHRSYFVRAAGVSEVSGNAQGYRLHHADFPDTPVPVARGKSAEVLGKIRV